MTKWLKTKTAKFFILEIPLPQNIKSFTEIKDYVYNLKVIDNQKILTQLSNNLEPRRT